MLTIQSARTALAEWFDDLANWRRAKAAQHGSGKRNVESSDSLRMVAAFIRSLPDDDKRLQRLAKCPFLFSPDGDIFMPPPEAGTGNVIDGSTAGGGALRLGFDEPLDLPDAWLSRWMAKLAKEAGDSERSMKFNS